MPHALALAYLLLPAPCRAQTARECRAIVDNLQRLTCYDKAVDSRGGASASLPAAAQDEHVVASFNGDGAQLTSSFTVSAPWELRWSPPDGGVTVFLKTLSGQVIERYPTGSEERLGQAPQPEGGEFLLDVRSFGPWRAQVVEVAR